MPRSCSSSIDNLLPARFRCGIETGAVSCLTPVSAMRRGRTSHGGNDLGRSGARRARSVTIAACRADHPPVRTRRRPRSAAPDDPGSTPDRWSAIRPTRSSPRPAHCSSTWAWSSTTMSRIAAEVGLKQSSLYYYFPQPRGGRRRAGGPGQRRAARARRRGSSPTAARRRPSFYRFVRGDVEALCALPFDINEIHRVAMRDRERFADYWSERERLERRLAGAGAPGHRRRRVPPRRPPAHRADDHGQRRGRAELVSAGLGAATASPSARRWPRSVVGGLLADGGRTLDDVVAEVSTLY